MNLMSKDLQKLKKFVKKNKTIDEIMNLVIVHIYSSSFLEKLLVYYSLHVSCVAS